MHKCTYQSFPLCVCMWGGGSRDPVTISEYLWHIMHEYNKSFRESCILTKQNNQLQHELIKILKINFEVIQKHLYIFYNTLHLKTLKTHHPSCWLSQSLMNPPQNSLPPPPSHKTLCPPPQ